MLENLKNQNRLSMEEEERIDRVIRIFILSVTGVVVAVIIWALVTKKAFGSWYYALILTLLATVWVVRCVVGGILKHSLAQRSNEQVMAYLKAAGLELVSYAGLAWFLIAMQGNGIFGAIVYLIGTTGARKQREIYYQEPGEEEEETPGDTAQPDEPEADAGSALTAEGTRPSETNTLPSAADRLQREKELEDGSV